MSSLHRSAQKRRHRGDQFEISHVLHSCTQVSLEELDGLQQELEAALSAVVVRLKSTFVRHFAFYHHTIGAKARIASR